MLIGLFHYDAATDIYTGAIRTPALQLRHVQFEATEFCRDFPAHYVVTVTTPLGKVWCGSAWRANVGGATYLCVELDDPTFPHPVKAFLTPPDAEGCASLSWGRQINPRYWKRPKRR